MLHRSVQWMVAGLVALLPFAASDDTTFSCSDYASALPLDVSDSFSKLALRVECNEPGEYLMPEVFHWHVYAIEGDLEPRYTVLPTGTLKPFVEGGALRMGMNQTLDVDDGTADSAASDVVEAAIELFIPMNQMKHIESEGTNQVIELLNGNSTQSLTIDDNSEGTTMYVSSPLAPVQVTSHSAGLVLEVEMSGSSSFVMQGADVHLRVKNLGGKLDVELDGTEQEFRLEGDYNSIVVHGDSNTAYVNSPQGCANVSVTGTDGACSEVEETVTVTTPACTSSSPITESNCSGSWSLHESLWLGTCMQCLLAMALWFAY